MICLQCLAHDPAISCLFDGLTASELGWLFSEAPLESVFTFDIRTRSVSRANFGTVPWPVMFLLGHRHKKHRFLSKKLPAMDHLLEATKDAVHKLRWREFFHDAEHQSGPIHRSMVYAKKIRPFTAAVVGKQTSDAVLEICDDLQASILKACSSSRSRQSGKRKWWANVLHIELAAHAWLAASRYLPIPTDKDGGFCLMLREDVSSLQVELLSGPWYSPVGCNHLSLSWQGSIVPQYNAICKEIVAVDPSTPISILTRSLGFGPKRAVSRLIHTVKTHKPVGKVALRPVHSSSSHSFLGLMSWVTMILTDILARFKHLVKSSDELISRLGTINVEDDDIFVHADLKDFYMTGDPSFLVHHCSLLVKSSIRKVFRSALNFLLTHQYVTSGLFPGMLWRVVTGSGMGLRSSAMVANAAFSHAVELMGLQLLHLSHASNKFAIKQYFRYADNLLFVCRGDFVRIKALLHNLEVCCVPFVGTLEEASHVGVDFLDLNLFKNNSKISIAPILKPTSLASVLSVFSAHPSGVHGAWMKCYVRTMHRHSTSLAWFRSFKAEVLRRLLCAGIDRAIVRNISISTNCTYSITPPVSLLNTQRHNDCVTWIRLPFHPMWSGAISKALTDFSSRHSDVLRSRIGTHCIKAAWHLTMPALGTVVQKI